MVNLENCHNILNNIKRYIDLTSNEEKEFAAIVKTTTVKKKAMILKPNSICLYQTYVLEGTFRSYFMTAGRGTYHFFCYSCFYCATRTF